jgi:hypothetical protein
MPTASSEKRSAWTATLNGTDASLSSLSWPVPVTPEEAGGERGADKDQHRGEQSCHQHLRAAEHG